jgi:hypothetical protein
LKHEIGSLLGHQFNAMQIFRDLPRSSFDVVARHYKGIDKSPFKRFGGLGTGKDRDEGAPSPSRPLSSGPT